MQQFISGRGPPLGATPSSRPASVRRCAAVQRAYVLSSLELLLLAAVELGSGGARPAASSRAACVSLAPFGGTPLFLCRVSSPSVLFSHRSPACIHCVFFSFSPTSHDGFQAQVRNYTTFICIHYWLFWFWFWSWSWFWFGFGLVLSSLLYYRHGPSILDTFDRNPVV